jgi:hypothetical protein
VNPRGRRRHAGRHRNLDDGRGVSDHGRAGMSQGNTRFGVGMVLGLAVGMLLYRLIFG